MRQALLLTLVLIAPALAAQPDQVQGLDLADQRRLAPYEDNYLVWGRMQNRGWAGRDEAALRARISFKYSFCGPQFDPTTTRSRPGQELAVPPLPSICPDWLQNVELFFAYTGKFDFYAGTRPSGPVIGRVNAPGLFLRWPTKRLFGLGSSDNDAVELGIQHRSNGQATDVTTDRGRFIADEQYAAGNRAYFDTISRSANFLVLATDLDYGEEVSSQRLRLRAKLRHYLGGEESDVSWGPEAVHRRRFADYERLSLHAWWTIRPGQTLDLLWRVGDSGLKTDSWTLGWEFKLLELPLYLRYHRGPMNTLSTYTQRQDSIGIGLRFSGY